MKAAAQLFHFNSFPLCHFEQTLRPTAYSPSFWCQLLVPDHLGEELGPPRALR